MSLHRWLQATRNSLMTARRTWALGSLAVASLACLWGPITLAGSTSCLPPDESVERGAIDVTLFAGPLDYAGEFANYQVHYRRLTVVGGSDTIGCHATFYVERPLGPIGLLDLTQPYLSEHRSLNEEHCVVVAGFILAKDTAYVGPGVTEDEQRLMLVDPAASIGNMHVVADVAFFSQGDPYLSVREDIYLEGVSGFMQPPLPIAVPHGNVSQLFARFDTSNLTIALLNVAYYDTNGDGVIDNTDLGRQELDGIRRAASDSWKLRASLDAGLFEAP